MTPSKVHLIGIIALIAACAVVVLWYKKKGQVQMKQNETNVPVSEEEETYGVDIDNAHSRARELISEKFFWDNGDELAPFGSDEGDTALAEFRQWRKNNPNRPIKECLVWTIESVGEMVFAEYSESILQEELILKQIRDDDYNDQQYIFTLDISVIATGFGQLVDEGKIDDECKPILTIALQRLITWAQLNKDWESAGEFISNLKVLQRVLEKA